MERFSLDPIGKVAIDAEGFAVRLDAPWRGGLFGLAGFGHVQVLWWAHRADTPAARAVVEVPRPYVRAPARLGVFATHSPARPNPLCLTTAPVLAVDPAAGVIRLAWIDAEDGTPVVDVKPYQAFERVREVREPAWCAHWPRWWEDAAGFDWAAELAGDR